MAKSLIPAVFSCIVTMSMFFSSSAQTCTKYSFSGNKLFSSCNDLPYLNSFLHWNYNASSGIVQIAYRHTSVSSSNWVSWGINPTSKGMIGTQAIVAYQQSNGSMRVYRSNIASYQTGLPEGDLSFKASDLSATVTGNEITIFATLELPKDSTTVNQVWQDGPLSGNAPGRHALTGPNVQSSATLNFLSGQSGSVAGGGNSRIRKRNIHGLLNAVSWGILMPLGAVIARYLKVFKSADPAWFYIHITCQSTAYVIGVAGWATGLKLGSESSGIQYSAHRTIGILLFCLGTLQVFALLLRPKKEHKYRVYWNVYHHSVGYLVIIISIINIFKGFDILNPDKKWKNAYVSVIMVLGISALLLEAFTWFLVLKRKKMESAMKMQNATRLNGNRASPHNRV